MRCGSSDEFSPGQAAKHLVYGFVRQWGICVCVCACVVVVVVVVVFSTGTMFTTTLFSTSPSAIPVSQVPSSCLAVVSVSLAPDALGRREYVPPLWV